MKPCVLSVRNFALALCVAVAAANAAFNASQEQAVQCEPAVFAVTEHEHN